MSLKDRIKACAYELGADLVGVGDVGRCAHSPPMMSPQGLFPGAKSVIVMAVHHPDACVELGGERHPQEIGPYSVQYLMNARLDEMSYRLATFIEREGFGVIPIVSSNIWRYNEYKDLKAVFAPDVSHIYMAVVAGLADLGFSGLALTPEYGARNRFITVISLGYDLTRDLENMGFRSVMTLQDAPGGSRALARAVVGTIPGLGGRLTVANTVVTRKRIASRAARVEVAGGGSRPMDRGTLTREVKACALGLGADLVGVASPDRFDALAAQIRPVFGGRRSFAARDRSQPFTSWQPEVAEETREVAVPSDYLPSARSVLVFALRYHAATLRFAGKPPAEAVGPYSYVTYVTNWLGATIAAGVARRLEAWGFRAVIAPDLMNTASFTASPRGPQDDLRANRFAAIAAGLGHLTHSGLVATPEFGIRQRFLAVVTDADLEPSALPAEVRSLCDTCERTCVRACPSRALGEAPAVEIELGGAVHRLGALDQLRCDWVKRYALMAGGGFGFLGSTANEAPGEVVTAESLAAALRTLDPIKKYRPVAAEPCVLECPYARQTQ